VKIDMDIAYPEGVWEAYNLGKANRGF
jgi:hypothetical protein